MGYVADLHIHSRFSRACSSALNIPNLAKWARYKGIDLMGTGDCLHPLWMAELKRDLKEVEGGYEYDGVRFLPSVELACIYSDKGRVRRIHIVIVLPTLESAEKLAVALNKKGVNLVSDGRPMMGLSSRELCDVVFKVEPSGVVIPAHCVLPSTLIHTSKGVKQIKDIKKDELVYTHKNRKRRVTDVISHKHKGWLYKIQPWYFTMGTEATSEHPFYVIRTKICPSTGDTCLPSLAHRAVCNHKFYESYKPVWITAESLSQGDVLLFSRFRNTTPMSHLSIAETLSYIPKKGYIKTNGTRGRVYKENLEISLDFCRLAGYFLAEGWISIKNEVGFCFGENEIEFIEEVKTLMRIVFGIDHCRVYRRRNSKGVELMFASKLVKELFAKLFYVSNSHKASNKTIPDWMLHLPNELQSQLMLGWWRGDKGYTVSRMLMNQMKVIFLRLGIIPSIYNDSAEKHLKRGNHFFTGREIKAGNDLFCFSNLAFFEDEYNLLSDPVFKKFVTKLKRRHGWIDEEYVYLPIRQISKQEFSGEVINLEVEEDNSYLTEFAIVHNCWTPWFSVFGSKAGYENFEDCFGEFSDQIFAVETGLSSEPLMNWRVSQLDNKAIVSFSDAHSLPRLGREVTIISGDPNFESLRESLVKQKILGTIEFFPEEGKYHYSGHRACGIVLDTEGLKKNGEICPVCKRELTLGVLDRTEKLADREIKDLGLMIKDGVTMTGKFNRPGFRMLVQLEEIIAESFNMGVGSQKVQKEYLRLVTSLGAELKILTKLSVEEIAKAAGPRIAEGVKRVRERNLSITPGFDNTYGVVKIWSDEEKDKKDIEQVGLF